MSSSMCTVCGPHMPLVRSDESVSILLALFSVFLLLLLSAHNIDLYRFRTSLFRLITKIIAEYFMRRLKFGRWMFENVTKQEVRWNHRTQLHLSEIYSFAILYPHPNMLLPFYPNAMFLTFCSTLSVYQSFRLFVKERPAIRFHFQSTILRFNGNNVILPQMYSWAIQWLPLHLLPLLLLTVTHRLNWDPFVYTHSFSHFSLQ